MDGGRLTARLRNLLQNRLNLRNLGLHGERVAYLLCTLPSTAHTGARRAATRPPPSQLQEVNNMQILPQPNAPTEIEDARVR